MGNCFIRISDIYAPPDSTPDTEDKNYPNLRHLLINRAMGIEARAEILRRNAERNRSISCDDYGFESLSTHWIDALHEGEQTHAKTLIDGSDSLSADQKQRANAAVVEFYGHVKAVSEIAGSVVAMRSSSVGQGAP